MKFILNFYNFRAKMARWPNQVQAISKNSGFTEKSLDCMIFKLSKDVETKVSMQFSQILKFPA